MWGSAMLSSMSWQSTLNACPTKACGGEAVSPAGFRHRSLFLVEVFACQFGIDGHGLAPRLLGFLILTYRLEGVAEV